jgi:hypothetical protein
MEVSSQLHASAALSPGERALGTDCIGDWVGPKAGLDTEAKKKLFLMWIEGPWKPTKNQSKNRFRDSSHGPEASSYHFREAQPSSD